MSQAHLVNPPHNGRNKRPRLTDQLRVVDELIDQYRDMTNTDFSLAPKVAPRETPTPRFGAHQITDRPGFCCAPMRTSDVDRVANPWDVE
jgi:hypothetical protein